VSVCSQHNRSQTPAEGRGRGAFDRLGVSALCLARTERAGAVPSSAGPPRDGRREHGAEGAGRGALELDPKHADARRNIAQAERVPRTLAAQPSP